jgi:hypothetical protein
LSAQSAKILTAVAHVHWPSHLFADGLPFGVDIWWAAAALLLIALGLAVARAIGDI